MKKREVVLNHNNKKIKIETTIVPWWYEGIGLMFSKKESARILLFNFGRDVNLAIHSWFVFYPFVAVWINSNNKVIGIEVVKSFRSRVLPEGGNFDRLIEIPVNSKNKEVISKLTK